MISETVWGQITIQCGSVVFNLKAYGVEKIQVLLDFAAGKKVLPDLVEILVGYGIEDVKVDALITACTAAS